MNPRTKPYSLRFHEPRNFKGSFFLILSAGEKLLLITLKGYTLQDGDIANLSATNAEKKLVKYMLSLKLTKSQKLELAEKCGFETKNGTIVLKNGKK